eukprot:UN01915
MLVRNVKALFDFFMNASRNRCSNDFILCVSWPLFLEVSLQINICSNLFFLQVST